jgi:hypothetical protein
MSAPFSISPSVSAVLIGLVILTAGFIGFVAIWWIRNVLRHRLPKPFLGDGSNVEWAEQKRAEIAGVQLAAVPMTSQSNEAIPWMAGEHLKFRASNREDGDGRHPERESLVESLSSEDDRLLLMTWLESTSHRDDAWVHNLLGRRHYRKQDSVRQNLEGGKELTGSGEK